MSSKCCFLYVLRLKPGCYYYIGTTTRTFKERLQEHLDGYGSKWSTKHGVHSVVSVTEIPIAGASQVEDETTIEYMRRYGCQNVRGGKYVRVIDDDATWWLWSFSQGKSMLTGFTRPRDVLPLLKRRVSHLLLELRCCVQIL